MSCHFSSNALPSDRVVLSFLCVHAVFIKASKPIRISHACRTLQFDDDRPRPSSSPSSRSLSLIALPQCARVQVKEYTLSPSIQPKCAYTFNADANTDVPSHITMHVCPFFCVCWCTPMAFNMEISLRGRKNYALGNIHCTCNTHRHTHAYGHTCYLLRGVVVVVVASSSQSSQSLRRQFHVFNARLMCQC